MTTLLELPDEIILRVLEYLDDGQARPFRQNTKVEEIGSQLHPLCLVCRRLSKITEPLLYKRIQIVLRETAACAIRGPNQPTKFDVLYTTLSDSAFRHKFVQHLELDWTYAKFSKCLWRNIVLALLEKGTSINTVTLECGGELFEDVELFEALNSNKIHNLRIDRVTFEALTRPGTFRDLRSLSLKHVVPKDWPAWDDSFWNEYNLPGDRYRLSPVEHLEVEFEGFHPCTILPVMQWIVGLKAVEFDFAICNSSFPEEFFANSDLQRMLNLHSNTLELIKYTAYQGNSFIDFRLFANLRELQISQFTATQLTTPAEAAMYLAAPRLTNLSIDCNAEIIEREMGIDAAYSCRNVYDWLEKFVKEYRSVMMTGGIERIRLDNMWYKSDESLKALKVLEAAIERAEIELMVHHVKVDWYEESEDEEATSFTQ